MIEIKKNCCFVENFSGVVQVYRECVPAAIRCSC